jgi:hypothetical protein
MTHSLLFVVMGVWFAIRCSAMNVCSGSHHFSFQPSCHNIYSQILCPALISSVYASPTLTVSPLQTAWVLSIAAHLMALEILYQVLDLYKSGQRSLLCFSEYLVIQVCQAMKLLGRLPLMETWDQNELSHNFVVLARWTADYRQWSCTCRWRRRLHIVHIHLTHSHLYRWPGTSLCILWSAAYCSTYTSTISKVWQRSFYVLSSRHIAAKYPAAWHSFMLQGFYKFMYLLSI